MAKKVKKTLKMQREFLYFCCLAFGVFGNGSSKQDKEIAKGDVTANGSWAVENFVTHSETHFE